MAESENIRQIRKLEEQLREAELGPDPEFFDQILADEAVLDGQQLKSKVVEAHQPGKMPKFTKVEMSGFKMVDHGNAVVVTCSGYYERAQGSVKLNFMRVWLRSGDRWQVIAGSTGHVED